MADSTAAPSEPPAEEPMGLEDAESLLRLALRGWLRTTGWTLGTGARLTRAALNGESVPDVLGDALAGARDLAWRVLGMADMDERLRGIVPDPVIRGRDDARYEDPEPRPKTLRQRGEELLRHSADVRYEEDAHPAYDRILGELAPDEGRILRFLALEGPQPSVDVRVGKALGVVGSQLVAPGLSMIGAGAGCRYGDRVPAYLNNLFRLGLIWFSREALEDPLRYQVLEAQPDVIEAKRGAGRGARTVRRSIHLTPFGEDFCQVCLPLHTAELDALPGDAASRPVDEAFVPPDTGPRAPEVAGPPRARGAGVPAGESRSRRRAPR